MLYFYKSERLIHLIRKPRYIKALLVAYLVFPTLFPTFFNNLELGFKHSEYLN